MKACVMQKYGYAIELQMRKEMDMEWGNSCYGFSTAEKKYLNHICR